MMLNESYYYCFACGANGDAIDLTAKLFDLNPRQDVYKRQHILLHWLAVKVSRSAAGFKDCTAMT